MLPTLSWIPLNEAALIVMAFNASSSSIPSLTAIAAHTVRYCIGVHGWSVIMATLTPALDKIPGVFTVKFLSSTLDLSEIDGPIITPTPSSHIISCIRCPSVQCSIVKSTSNSLAILIAVSISSAL